MGPEIGMGLVYHAYMGSLGGTKGTEGAWERQWRMLEWPISYFGNLF